MAVRGGGSSGSGGKFGGMLAVIVFRLVGGSSQREGKADFGCSVGVTGPTTKRGNPSRPPSSLSQKKKVLGFFCGVCNSAV